MKRIAAYLRRFLRQLRQGVVKYDGLFAACEGSPEAWPGAGMSRVTNLPALQAE